MRGGPVAPCFRMTAGPSLGVGALKTRQPRSKSSTQSIRSTGAGANFSIDSGNSNRCEHKLELNAAEGGPNFDQTFGRARRCYGCPYFGTFLSHPRRARRKNSGTEANHGQLGDPAPTYILKLPALCGWAAFYCCRCIPIDPKSPRNRVGACGWVSARHAFGTRINTSENAFLLVFWLGS